MSEDKPAHTPTVEACGELSDWFAVLVESRDQIKGWTEREKEAKAQLTRILEARDTDVQVHGQTVLRAVNRGGTMRINSAKLKKDLPDVYERYRTMTAGSYRLELVDPEADPE